MVEALDSSTTLTYTATKGQWPTSGRDMCVVTRRWSDADGTLWICSTSVEDPKVPTKSDKVRAHLRLNGWRLRPRPNGGTEISYITDIDLAGSIPAFILQVRRRRIPGPPAN